ncbi:hypothetical protein [Streptomyces sp. H39-C1]|uniref:hypothetical protein n=1 Tax=Streptomyces sp. H39-C1 TaxID=3004355 RepID=UPI0022AF5689|nr:hypothetical protein [Streptomyces sp. H39-C1]MCZ4103550.1 hypothetical protein [Streptomyces sp. H39-C1]
MRKRSGRPPRFAAIPNTTVDDAVAMDLEALGLLAVLIRHRDGWDIQLATIARQYGYGRDGLAGAMGRLQVARYVVKIRIMAWEGNQWSTEMVVYDTPATDAEVAALLTSVEHEPDVRQVQLIAPTPKAMGAASKRRAKLAAKADGPKLNITVPRLPESRESLRRLVARRQQKTKTPPVRPSVNLRWVRARLRARMDGRTAAARMFRKRDSSTPGGRVRQRLTPRRTTTTAQQQRRVLRAVRCRVRELRPTGRLRTGRRSCTGWAAACRSSLLPGRC